MLDRITFSKYLSLVLRALNVKVVYTLPGDLTLELLSGLEENGTKILCFPDEESVMSAADIHASLSGLSLVICADGYSLSKMINPLVACRLRYSAVSVVVVSNFSSDLCTSSLNQYPQPTRVQYMCNSIGIESYRMSEGLSFESLAEIITRPITSHQPFALEITSDVVSSSVWINNDSISDVSQIGRTGRAPRHEALLAQIASFQKGVCILGNSLNRYRSQPHKLVLKSELKIAYMTLPSIKGLIYESDDRYLGTYLGDFSSGQILDALKDAEKVVLIGVDTFELAWTSWKPLSGASGWNLKKELMAQGKSVISINLDRYGDGDETTFHSFSLLETFFEGASEVVNENIESTRIDPTGSSYYDRLASTLSTLRNSVLVADVGLSTLSLFNIRLSSCSTFISNTVWANMGSCFAAGLAASLCIKNKKIWIIVGDGSAIMSVHDLAVFARYDIEVCIIVLDNNGYLTERVKYAGSFNNGFQIDWLECARSMGFGTCLKCDNKEDIPKMVDSLRQSESTQSLLWIKIPQAEYPDAVRDQIRWTSMKKLIDLNK